MRKALKIFLFFLGGVFILLLAVVGWLNTRSGKNFIRIKALSYIQNKIKTPVYADTLDYSLPSMVELRHVVFLDQRRDTLLAARRLRVDINMLKLLANKVDVKEIQLEGGYVNIYRIAPDTLFNFSYIAKIFASPPDSAHQNKPVDSSGQLELDIKLLSLKNMRVHYNDHTGGDLFGIDVDSLRATIQKIDPYSMDFRINRLYTNGIRATFILDSSYLEPILHKDAVKLSYLSANELDLNNSSFQFTDKNQQLFFDLNIRKLLAHPKNIDLNNQHIAIDDIVIDTTGIKLSMGRKAKAKAKQLADTLVQTNPVASMKWHATINTVKLNGVNFIMTDETKPRLPYGLDYSHLNIPNLVLDARNIVYTTDTIAGSIKHLSGRDQSGLDIRELHTDLLYHPKGASLRNLFVQTPYTTLQNYIAMQFPSIEAVSNGTSLLQAQFNITNSVVGMKDVLLFAPQLRSQPLFTKYGNDRIRVEAIATQQANGVLLKKLILQGFNNTYVNVTGKINNIADPKTLNYDLSIAKLQTNKEVVSTFLPPSILKQVNLPNSFSISGHISGNTTNFNTDLVAVTSDGSATIKGLLTVNTKGLDRYNVTLKTNKLNIGKIVRRQDIIGSISANVYAKGQGVDINRMNTMLKGDIYSMGFMGYNYNSIKFNAKINAKKTTINLTSADPNAHLTLNGHGDFSKKYPSIVAQLEIDSANLKALHLSKEELKIRGIVDADIPVLNPDYPRGTITANRPTVVLRGTRYFMDSMYISSQPNADSGNYIVVNADAIQSVISGHTPLTQIGNIIQSHISRHLAINRKDSLKAIKAAPANYDLHVTANIYDRPLIHALFPGLKYMDTVHMDASITPNNLYANVLAPQVQYNDIFLSNGKANITGGNEGLAYNISADRFKQNNLQFWYASATGTAYRQSITSKISISDSAHTERYAVSGVYHQHPDRQEVHIDNGLKLNYKTWQVSQPNSIVFSKNGFYVQNFQVSNGGESIRVNSDAQQFSAPMTVAINNFLISNISEIAQADTTLVNGVLSGNFKVQNVMKNPQISGTAQIQNLSVRNDTIGNVDMQIAQASTNVADARATVSGRGNNVTLSGKYYPTAVNGNNFDLNATISALNLQTVEGLAMNQIRNSTGNIKGNLRIQGTVAAPKITGELQTDNLTTTISALGTAFKMPAEKVRFTGNGIEFENFKLVDSNGNVGLVNGKIITRDYKNMDLALTLHANKWQVLNSTAKDNKLYYGKLVISADLKIEGNPMMPSVNGNLTVHDTTKLTVAVPETTPGGAQEREGVIEFIDVRDTNRYKLLAVADTTPRLGLRLGSSMNVNVTIEKNAEFNILIDQATGDFLKIRGQGSLNTMMNPDGTIGVTGVYEIRQGYYELNYSFIKRRFDVQAGSTVTFAGDPLDATVKASAIYVADVPPYDLVEKQISDPAQLVYYRQRLPFEVHLDINGPAMKPTIAFDIVLPEEKHYRVSPDVLELTEAKLADLRNNPSEQQKQVFAVLILNRFVSDNPFESGSAGYNPAYLARQSASRLISEQLNQMGRNLISGIDLNFDLQTTEDYTTGEKRNRTDLNVAASKRLLNDRLTVTLGNDFELESANPNTNQNSSLMPGNIAADYQLTESGRYKVRIFRRNNFEDIVTGYVTETGLSFIVTAEYNRFRNLFINRRRLMRRMEEDNAPKTAASK
jgi:translocation and assembly module TamB